MHNKIKVVVAAIRDHSGRVFLQQRTNDNPVFPGHWECPGGKVDKGETEIQALKRELEEELGLTSITVEYQPFLTMGFTHLQPPCVILCYFVHINRNEPMKLNAAQESGWFDLDKVKTLNKRAPSTDIIVEYLRNINLES
jgi:8-oxo-dGTP diphosphatase